MKGGIIYKKDWETIIGEYNWKIKMSFSGQFEKIMQVGINKELGGVVCQAQKNVKNKVKES